MIRAFQSHVDCVNPFGLHRMAYRRWEPVCEPRAEVVCVHGLTRNSRDFALLAESLCHQGFAVTAPDIVGRGRSDRMVTPDLYHPGQYLADLRVLLGEVVGVGSSLVRAAEATRRLAAWMGPWAQALSAPWVEACNALAGDAPKRRPLIWVGTSMGGLLGLYHSALFGEIDALVLNDVGPELPGDFLGELQLLASAREARIAHLNDAVRVLKTTSPGFAPLSTEHWRLLADASVVRRDGRLRWDFDQRIFSPIERLPAATVGLWRVWEQLDIPTLTLRGQRSNVLLRSAAARMSETSEVITVPKVGHCPALLADDQLAIVSDWVSTAAAQFERDRGVHRPAPRVIARAAGDGLTPA
ncbi:pimeloyl-ACP methyl ester carboxylesterase [Natronocella acetinitrilica]|uniref:Pimeloyl-ACP methyl ester carboxylesterase n=1 Tax=Natronocella acetinitrilica TaxID=414046 RepID=A0AAE3KBF0_9GAMM|nr:alpha/beta hydrolase [Natronocella acetinitrilica]MCP1674601.1 pimeloyl-ACP methyl ester carboxylesterase [Natronocella acetinitrilica]